MKRDFYLGLALAMAGAFIPANAAAQSDDSVSLGRLARSVRQGSKPVSPVVIDNDNLSKVMDEVESHRLNGAPLFSVDRASNNFSMSSPDGTCSLSFNANATSLLTTPYVAEELPQSELAKLEGPATLEGDTLQVSVYNGTAWDLKEITVGLTIVRREDLSAGYYGAARLMPAAAEETLSSGKPSDLTLLLHLKGSAVPLTTTEFQEKLTGSLAPDQDWHWAIIAAKGIPPGPLAVPFN